MKLLLDTHVVLWWTHDSAKISAAAPRAAGRPTSRGAAERGGGVGDRDQTRPHASSRSATAWPSSWSEEGSVNCPSAWRTPPRWSNSRHITPTRSTGCWLPKRGQKAPSWSPATSHCAHTTCRCTGEPRDARRESVRAALAASIFAFASISNRSAWPSCQLVSQAVEISLLLRYFASFPGPRLVARSRARACHRKDRIRCRAVPAAARPDDSADRVRLAARRGERRTTRDARRIRPRPREAVAASAAKVTTVRALAERKEDASGPGPPQAA